MCQTVPRALVAALAPWSIAFLLSPAPARACSRSAPTPTLLGQPADKDSAVPTNVLLHYALPYGTLPLEDAPDVVPGVYSLHAASGELVDLHVTRPSLLQLELVPTQPLKPNTAYTLDAHWKLPNGQQADAAVRFETGAGPLDETPEPPEAVMLSYELDRDYSAACGPRRADTCIAVQDDTSLIEYTVFGEDDDEPSEAWSSLVRGSSFAQELTGVTAGGRFGCVELRRFGANGARSQPLRLCRDEAAMFDLTSLVEEPSIGCAATGLQWCDESGKSGSEPGPGDPRGTDGAVYCAGASAANGSRTSSQSTLPQSPRASEAAKSNGEMAAAPAAGSCSAMPVQPSAPRSLSLLFSLACLGMYFARRRKT